MSERKDNKFIYIKYISKSISSKVVWLMMSLWGRVSHHCANSENKCSLAIAPLIDKLKKIPFHIRKTNDWP